MTTAKKSIGFVLALAAVVALFFATAALASAAAPAWRIDSVTNTAAQPGSALIYNIDAVNIGTASSTGTTTMTIELPPGLVGVSASGFSEEIGSFSCPVGPSVIQCKEHQTVGSGANGAALHYKVTVEVEPGLSVPQVLTASIGVENDGASPASASTVDSTRIEAPAPFGIDAFDNQVEADAARTPATGASSHPYANTTSIDFNTHTDPLPMRGNAYLVEATRDALVDLPPGFVGSTAGVDRCASGQLANTGPGPSPQPLCPVASQVGTTLLRLVGFNSGSFTFFANALGPFPVFNMVPPPGVPARFGFNVDGSVVVLDARLRSAGDYGLSIDGRKMPEGLAVDGTSFNFWGVPSDPSHDPQRACPGRVAPWASGISCASPAPPKPFFRNPTSCTAKANEGIATTLQIDSWEHPGLRDENGEPLAEPAWVGATSESHEAPGYPYPTGPSTFPEGYSGPERQGGEVGVEGCEEVPFEPTMSVKPTTDRADSPTGLEFDLQVPQEECWGAKATVAEAEEAPCQSDLQTAEVTLPQGMSVNPSSASGLGSCTSSQIGLMTEEGKTPIHFDEADPSCPESSRIGTVKIKTPLIEEELEGSVYLAAQNDNPFHSLISFYIVAKGAGAIVKLPAHVFADPSTGQLRTVVDELPQLPFSTMHLVLFPGQRAALITPLACGEYATRASLTPWSHAGTEGEGGTPIAQLSSSFEISKGPAGAPCPSRPAAFAPKLEAGTQNPLAGAYSPFNLKLTREDGSQRLAGLSLTLPPGMIGKLAGLSYCPEAALGAVSPDEGSAAAQLASPSCPASSLLGTVTVGAGAGATPFYLQTGKVYLADPYKGAPLSLAIITPALAGPFDLGNVLLRTALRIDPSSTQITAVSDPLPQILDGIPLDLRDIRVNLNRPGFTLNPTSCDEMSVAGTASGTEGASAALSDRFQLGNCENLPFKPKLSFRFSGATKRTGHPALQATLTAKPGEAGIAKVAVALPNTEILDNAHINSPCTRVQFAQNACPPGSVLGHARAITPLLEAPLEGPVYLMTGFGHLLPDLVADLGGQIHVVLDGRVDTNKAGGLRNTFEAVPDAPVSKFTISLAGGHKGLLQNTTDICARPIKASVQMDAHNGKTHDTSPVVRVKGCGGGGKGKGHKRRG